VVASPVDFSAKDGTIAGRTPLHWAVATGNIAAIKLLIANGADVAVTAASGATPLHEAVARETSTVAKLLIENGADVAAISASGMITPLEIAMHSENAELTKLFIENGAAFSHLNYADGSTPLHHAAGHHERTEVLKLLIENGADISATASDCATEHMPRNRWICEFPVRYVEECVRCGVCGGCRDREYERVVWWLCGAIIV
jgi:ankyrin repeat protein